VNDPWLRAAGGVLWVGAALIVVPGAFAALLHRLPGMREWRGVPALAIILATGSALLAWRLLFDRGWRS
jgi:hypothetical protein